MILNEWKNYPASIDSFSTILDDILSAAQDAEMANRLKNKLRLGIEEAVVNIINYAYKSEGEIFIKTSADTDYFYIELVDFGTPFNPINNSDPRANDKSDVKYLKPGGKGILLIKKIFVSISYSYDLFQGKSANHLILKFKKNV